MVEKVAVGMLSLGIMVGLIFPGLPVPLNGFNGFLWIIFLVIALVLFVKK